MSSKPKRWGVFELG